VILDHRDHKVQLARRVPRELKDRSDHRGHKALRDRKVLRGIQVLPDLRGPKVLKARKDQRVHRDRLESDFLSWIAKGRVLVMAP
jgi:hypothetical protein